MPKTFSMLEYWYSVRFFFFSRCAAVHSFVFFSCKPQFLPHTQSTVVALDTFFSTWQHCPNQCKHFQRNEKLNFYCANNNIEQSHSTNQQPPNDASRQSHFLSLLFLLIFIYRLLCLHFTITFHFALLRIITIFLLFAFYVKKKSFEMSSTKKSSCMSLKVYTLLFVAFLFVFIFSILLIVVAALRKKRHPLTHAKEKLSFVFFFFHMKVLTHC